ncbi:MAG: hypothetical protein ACI9WC_000200 [Arenicella sp.]|jgi:hypothetical protein
MIKQMNNARKLLCLLLSLVLLWLTSVVVSAGIADLRYSAGKYYLNAAIQGENERLKRDLLKRAYVSMQSAQRFDSDNSSYQLHSARINFELDRYESPDGKLDTFYQQGKIHITKGLQASPTRADLWVEYAKRLFEKEGATKATLAALDKALEFGPKEQQVLMLNAAITLYSWNQLAPIRQRNAWMLVLDAMDDTRLVKQINNIARQTGWEKQLQRSLQDRKQ